MDAPTWLLTFAAAWVFIIPSAIAAVATTADGDIDYTGIAALVVAIGIITGQVLTWLTARRAANTAAAATAAAIEAKEQSIATAKAVDGKMTEVVKLVTEKVTAEATLIEKAAQKDREAAVALAVTTEAKTAPTLDAAIVVNGKSQDATKATAVLAEAAIQAKTLLESAAVTAAALLTKAKEDAKK